MTATDADRRNVEIIELSVDPISDYARWAADIEETQGHAPNYRADFRGHDPRFAGGPRKLRLFEVSGDLVAIRLPDVVSGRSLASGRAAAGGGADAALDDVSRRWPGRNDHFTGAAGRGSADVGGAPATQLRKGRRQGRQGR
jgi:hypothetical protein